MPNLKENDLIINDSESNCFENDETYSDSERYFIECMMLQLATQIEGIQSFRGKIKKEFPELLKEQDD